MSQYSYDVIVVGAGHAGIEAALATARTGLKTALFTISLDSVGNMPCNPSIGGTGKGHLVFEIDALGGEMGYQADRVTLQSRTLNTGKGAAVRSKRVQADRHLYSQNMKELLEKSDSKRESYYNYFTYKQWGAAASYDVCLNSSLLGVDGCVKVISDIIKGKGWNK